MQNPQEFRNIAFLFLPEIWLNPLFDDDFCSSFGTFYVMTRVDRIHGTHGGVFTLCRHNSALKISEINIEKDYDFSVVASPENSHISVVLLILLYQFLPQNRIGLFPTFSIIASRMLFGKLKTSTRRLTSSSCPSSCCETSMFPTQIDHLCIALMGGKLSS